MCSLEEELLNALIGIDFGSSVIGNIIDAPSLVESLGEFSFCRPLGGVWAVVDGPNR